MERCDVWSEECEVRFCAVDKSDSMILSAALNFFQEAAISHAHNLGVGREAMAKANQVWILSRMTVLVERRPKYGETFTVRTWPRGGEKLFAIRDFEVCDYNNLPVIKASSSWIIIDLDTRRPLRPEAAMKNLPLNEGLNSGLPIPPRLQEHLSMEKAMERRALYNELDYNGHVNNVSYIRWIEDAMNPVLLEQAKKMRLEINYLNEIRPGELTGIWKKNITAESSACTNQSNAFAFEGKIERGKEGLTAFRSELRLFQN